MSTSGRSIDALLALLRRHEAGESPPDSVIEQASRRAGLESPADLSRVLEFLAAWRQRLDAGAIPADLDRRLVEFLESLIPVTVSDVAPLESLRGLFLRAMTDEAFRRKILESPAGTEIEPGVRLDSRARAVLLDFSSPIAPPAGKAEDLEDRIAALYLKFMSSL